MKIEYFHASKYGNGATVAEEFKRQMADRGVQVNVHNVREIRIKELPPADLYLFSSPGRFGKPVRDMQHFLKSVRLTEGMKYAVLSTEMAPDPAMAIRQPSEEEIGNCQRIIPIMNNFLQKKGLIRVSETRIFVTGIKGPLEKDWQKAVADFVLSIPILP